LVLTSDVAPSSPPKSLAHKAWVYNDGSGDVGDTASQFLLVRNLDTMLQEEAIATGMAKLEVIPKRILLIRDRKTKVSWGFGFVEYQDVSVDPFHSTFNHSSLETHWINI
jgi:RNA recognition motif-containing protein